MKFFAIAATFVAAVAAQGYSAAAEETCSTSIVTVTETQPAGVHVPSAPSGAPTLPPYPTGEAPYPSAPAPSVPAPSGAVPSGVAPSGTAPVGTAAPVPSASASFSSPPGYFEGAASSVQVGGLVAGVGAFAAFFL